MILLLGCWSLFSLASCSTDMGGAPEIARAPVERQAVPGSPGERPRSKARRGRGSRSAGGRCDLDLALVSGQEVPVFGKNGGDKVGSIPPYLYVRVHGVEADIGDGLIRFDKAQVVMADDGGGAGEIPANARQGWVRMKDVRLSIEATGTTDGGGVSARLFSEPDIDSALVQVLDKAKHPEAPVDLVDCKGNWVKGEVFHWMGWIHPAQLCTNPLTTCSGYDAELDRRFDD